MKVSTLAAAAALFVGLSATTPALALSEGAVGPADVARVSSEVSAIADAGTRALAEQKVWQASDALIERNQYHAYIALQGALDLADGTQVTQR
jgi:hypothetical protein